MVLFGTVVVEHLLLLNHFHPGCRAHLLAFQFCFFSALLGSNPKFHQQELRRCTQSDTGERSTFSHPVACA